MLQAWKRLGSGVQKLDGLRSGKQVPPPQGDAAEPFLVVACLAGERGQCHVGVVCRQRRWKGVALPPNPSALGDRHPQSCWVSKGAFSKWHQSGSDAGHRVDMDAG